MSFGHAQPYLRAIEHFRLHFEWGFQTGGHRGKSAKFESLVRSFTRLPDVLADVVVGGVAVVKVFKVTNHAAAG